MKIPPEGLVCPNCKAQIFADPGFSITSIRRRQREEQYAKIGKRCCNCHAYQPVTEYNKSVACADGLQPICKSCAVLNLDLRVKGGPELVRLTRAALQAKNDAANSAAGRK